MKSTTRHQSEPVTSGDGQTWRRLMASEDGVSAVEYTLLLLLIGLYSVFHLTDIGDTVAAWYYHIVNML